MVVALLCRSDITGQIGVNIIPSALNIQSGIGSPRTYCISHRCTGHVELSASNSRGRNPNGCSDCSWFSILCSDNYSVCSICCCLHVKGTIRYRYNTRHIVCSCYRISRIFRKHKVYCPAVEACICTIGGCGSSSDIECSTIDFNRTWIFALTIFSYRTIRKYAKGSWGTRSHVKGRIAIYRNRSSCSINTAWPRRDSRRCCSRRYIKCTSGNRYGPSRTDTLRGSRSSFCSKCSSCYCTTGRTTTNNDSNSRSCICSCIYLNRWVRRNCYSSGICTTIICCAYSISSGSSFAINSIIRSFYDTTINRCFSIIIIKTIRSVCPSMTDNTSIIDGKFGRWVIYTTSCCTFICMAFDQSIIDYNNGGSTLVNKKSIWFILTFAFYCSTIHGEFSSTCNLHSRCRNRFSRRGVISGRILAIYLTLLQLNYTCCDIKGIPTSIAGSDHRNLTFFLCATIVNSKCLTCSIYVN